MLAEHCFPEPWWAEVLRSTCSLLLPAQLSATEPSSSRTTSQNPWSQHVSVTQGFSTRTASNRAREETQSMRRPTKPLSLRSFSTRCDQPGLGRELMFVCLLACLLFVRLLACLLVCLCACAVCCICVWLVGWLFACLLALLHVKY